MVAGLALALGLGGCRVTATVHVDVTGRGGEVVANFVLDDDALGVFGPRSDDPAAALVAGADVTGLGEAGWVIGAPRRPPGGGVEIQLNKAFGRPDDLGRILEELAGGAGPLSGFRLSRDRSWTGVEHRLEGTLDARALTGLDNAPELLARLADAGVDSRRVAELLARRATDGFRLRLRADLPGATDTNTSERERGLPVWQVEGDETVRVRASSSRTDLARPALLVLAVALTAAAVLVMRARRPGWSARDPAG